MRVTTFLLAVALMACAKSKKAEPPEEGRLACYAPTDCPEHWYCLKTDRDKRCYSSKDALADAGTSHHMDRDAAVAASGTGGQESHPMPDAALAPEAGGGSGGTTTEPNVHACSTNDVMANPVVPTVMLVIDGSSSMNGAYGNNPDGGVSGMVDAGSAITRWQALRHSLIDPAEGVVPALQGRLKFGLAVFATAPTCPLPLGVIDPALDNANSITSALPTQAPGQFTPTGDAIDQVVDRLPDPSAPGAAGPQIVALITDGDPNSCGDMVDPQLGLPIPPMTDYAPSIAAALKLQQKHLRMYVVGVGDEAAKMHLQQMANLGAGLAQDASPGAMVYYPADPAAVTDTLRTLIASEVSCDVQLSGNGVMPGQECKGLVTLNGNMLACNDPDGWVLKDATHVTLQGAACETFRSRADVVVRAQFPCDVQL